VRAEIRLPEDAVDDDAPAAADLQRLPYRKDWRKLHVKPGYTDEAETLLRDLFAAARQRYSEAWSLSWGSPSA